jgi:hypothetical protein
MDEFNFTPVDAALFEQAYAVAIKAAPVRTPADIPLVAALAVMAVPWDSRLNELRLVSRTEATLISGIPILENEETTAVAIKSGMLGLLARRGWPWNWLQQGPTFQLVEPKAGAAQNSNGSRDVFGPHIDDAPFGPCTPQTLLLVARNNAAGASTGWASARDIAKGLPAALLKQARSAQYQIRAPRSLGLGELWVGPVPLIYMTRGGEFQLNFASYAARTASPDLPMAQAALEYLRAMAFDATAWVMLQPGQALMIPNRHGMHSRDTITGDRSLMRSYWNDNIDVLRNYGGMPGENWLFDAKLALDRLWSSSTGHDG